MRISDWSSDVCSSDLPDAATLAALIRQLDANRVPHKTPLSWITASAGKDTRLILVEDVAYFRAANKYTTVLTAAREAPLRTPIRALLGLLDPAMFKQVHRSTIAHLNAIEYIARHAS